MNGPLGEAVVIPRERSIVQPGIPIAQHDRLREGRLSGASGQYYSDGCVPDRRLTATWQPRGVCVFLANTVHGHLSNRTASVLSRVLDVTRNIRTFTTSSQPLHIVET